MNIWLNRLIYVLISIFMFSCASTEPMKMKLPGDEKVTAPETKITKFTDTLKDFGLMLEIYRSDSIKIVLKEISDKTGASTSTGSEIQQSITEISKSTLNSMGENVVYVEYDPEFVAMMQQTGYSDFGNKLIPSVVLTGAITEFDRSLVSWEKGTDIGAEGDITGVSKALPSKTIGIDYSESAAHNKARITVDFNMKNFQTLASIPGMTMVNSMEVQKAVAKKEVGITLFGPSFGMSGSMKKVQGRHDAVRLLVQSSLLQLVGRYAGVPYWRLFGNDAIPDQEVLKSWKRGFGKLSEADRISLLQRYLNLHGYDVNVTGALDSKTKTAFADFCSKNNIESNALNAETFLKIYLTIPINEETYERAQALNEGGNLGRNQQAIDSSTDISKVGSIMSDAFSHYKKGDYQTAISKFEDSLKVSPTPVAYYFIALCYHGMKDVKKAVASLETGTKTFNDFVLWKALGLGYSELGDKAKAKKAFTSANAINPNDKQIKFFLEQK